MLDRTGVRHKVVIISACYSGVFIPRLAEADTLVITAADANHSSFECRDKAKWTYFGDAFFNVALRRAQSLNEPSFLRAHAMAVKIHAQVTGYGPQPGNTQALLIVTLEFDGPSVDDVHGPDTERRR
jgi:hypothetical protein